jgi:cytidylate kinase
VRSALFTAQREAYPGHGLVAEGRDMGTVVFPDAPVKFFVDTRVDVRAARRFGQLQGQEGISLEAIRRELEARDHQDSTRATAPTVAAPDAIHVDNSDRPFAVVVEEMVRVVRERLG